MIENVRREYAYHAFARISVLLGSLAAPSSIKAIVRKLEARGNVDEYDIIFHWIFSLDLM